MKTIDFFKKSWEKIKKESKKDFSNEIFYSKYFLQTFLIKNEGKKFFITTPNHFTKEVIEKDYLNILEERFSAAINTSSELIFVTENEKDLKEKINEEKINEENKTNLVKKLSFENLIVGEFNQNAYKAINSLIDQEISPWNVVFLYGQTGIGKTHLINAAGLKFLNKFPEKNVLYISTEDFLRKAYNALSVSGSEIEKFKDEFNNIDLLLVDDIQFLSNKDKLNEIFFGIFNNLINQNKKIIMTSDKLPENLKIDDRMISRFNSGLSIKISSPDIKTTVEIIKLKINNLNRRNEFTSGAINCIANRSNNDIRRLEGLINRIIFYSLNSMDANEIINEQKIKEVIDGGVDLFSMNNNYKISPQAIIENICSNYNVKVKSVISKQRNQSITFVRKVCMYVLREKLSLSYNEIGSFFSNRNHATVIDSCKYIENLIETDENLKNYILNIIEKL
ncbi:MAG: chromosomal replication initiator protein DnaA [Mycoplasma sp.]|nr:chromosomal replication initiator protein DnaA [Mycoplasma sp.]